MNAVTLYNEIWSSTDELEARCKQSLKPRGSDMLHELFATFGPTAQSEVIDIGCRDASCLWGIYQMLGKLQPTVYLLAKDECGATLCRSSVDER